MDRRAFLGLLSAGVVGLVLDPERALLVPGSKTVFLPPVYSHKTYLTIDVITSEALRVFEQTLRSQRELNFMYSIDMEGVKIGTTLNIRKPVQYTDANYKAMIEACRPLLLHGAPAGKLHYGPA